jgi:hypothetical protein
MDLNQINVYIVKMNLPADRVKITVNGQQFIAYRCGDLYRLMKYGDWRYVPEVNNNGVGYNQIGCGNKKKLRQRIIAYAFLNLDIDDLTQQIDHIDGNKLNNHVDNLRIVSFLENMHNLTKARGYYWNKRDNKWIAQICANGKSIHLGYFKLETDARAAYLAAKLIYHPSSPVYSA